MQANCNINYPQLSTNYNQEVSYSTSKVRVTDLCRRVNDLILTANKNGNIENSLTVFRELEKEAFEMAAEQRLNAHGVALPELEQLIIIIHKFVQQLKNESALNLTLPDEILQHIFCYITKPEDLCNLSKVCKSFNKFAEVDDVWRKICQQEDPLICKKKIEKENWKNFYRESIYFKSSEFCLVKVRAPKKVIRKFMFEKTVFPTIPILVDMWDPGLKGIHIKRAIHRQCPNLPISQMILYVVVDELKDQDLLHQVYFSHASRFNVFSLTMRDKSLIPKIWENCKL